MKEIKSREEMDPKYTWDLTNLYASDEEWEKSYEKTLSIIDDIEKYKGKLSENGKTLLEALASYENISMNVNRLYTYAGKKHHQDTANATYQALESRAGSLQAKVVAKCSFMTPEIVSLGEDTVKEFINDTEGLKVYTNYLNNTLRDAKHVLSKEQEELLAKISEVTSAPASIYSMIGNADIKYKPALDSDGKQIEVTNGNALRLFQSKDRVLRKNTYTSLYEPYLALKNTIAKTYASAVKGAVIDAKLRNHKSSLEASLFADNLPVEIYTNLIETVSANLHHQHKYIEVVKDILGYDELHAYDMNVPLVDVEFDIPYEEAKEIVIKSLEPMGEEYLALIHKAFDEKWIDVYENKNKRSGAYSWSTYGATPHILMNYNGSLRSMFTLTHELGHALHSCYTNNAQPAIYGSYTIFLAEIASTVNEALLMDYLLKTTTDKEKLKYLLRHYINNFRGTLIRQAMFAEFEMLIHGMEEKGQPLTVDSINKVYKDLDTKYLGKIIEESEYTPYEWTKIPHFYRPFYVFQYATGFSAAIAISKAILSEGKPAVDRYVDMLKSGKSEYSIDILKKAGVDMTTKKPIEDAMSVFADIVKAFEEAK